MSTGGGYGGLSVRKGGNVTLVPQQDADAVASNIFSGNPRVQAADQKKWEEEKGLAGIFDPQLEEKKEREKVERAARDRAREEERYREGVIRASRLFSAEEEDHTPLLKMSMNELKREDFHENRWRCILHPDRAMSTLGPFAQLEVYVIEGKDLVSRDLTLSFQPTVNPYVQIFLDDELLDRSKCARKTTAPTWRFRRSVDVTCPSSMLRIQVADQSGSNLSKDDEQLGFVEMSLADIPYDRELEGWVELRLQENLQRTCDERYKAHCNLRDDQQGGGAARRLRTRQQQRAREEERQSLLRGEVPESLLDSSQNDKDRQGDKRSKSFFTSCVNYLADRTAELGVPVPSTLRDEHRHNAGELKIRLRLSMLDAHPEDGLFALALTPESVHDHGTHLQVNGKSNFELQHLWDDVMDVKRQVFEDSVVCVCNCTSYLLQWRSTPLSFILVASFVCPVLYSVFQPHVRIFWLLSAVFSGVLAFALLLLSWKQLRFDMIHGGSNAPLTQEGFERVAAWRQTDQMVRFLERIVADLHGVIKNDQAMRSFAARCFHNGRPRISLSDLRTAIKTAEWMQIDQSVPAPKIERESGAASAIQPVMLLQEGFASTRLRFGDLVLVDDWRRATVKRFEDPYVFVDYDDVGEAESSTARELSKASAEAAAASKASPEESGSGSPAGRSAEVVHSTADSANALGKLRLGEEKVHKERISFRAVVKAVSKDQMSEHLAYQVRTLCILVDDCKRMLCPAARFCAAVLSWQRWGVALSLVVFLGCISAISIVGFFMESQQSSLAESELARKVVRFTLLANAAVVLAAFVTLFIVRAKWFIPCRSICRILYRRLCLRRRAPECWPFFRETARVGLPQRLGEDQDQQHQYEHLARDPGGDPSLP